MTRYIDHSVELDYWSTGWIAPAGEWIDYMEFQEETGQTTTSIVYPLVYQGVEYEDYGVCINTGNIWSKKFSNRNPCGEWRALVPSVSGKNPYYKVGITTGWREKKTIQVHVAVHETLTDIPRPANVSQSDWDSTPRSVKRSTRGIWMVNHIDHDKLNYKPSNLEWVTAQGNAQAYQTFKKTVSTA